MLKELFYYDSKMTKIEILNTYTYIPYHER